jgi:hypothetical protein
MYVNIPVRYLLYLNLYGMVESLQHCIRVYLDNDCYTLVHGNLHYASQYKGEENSQIIYNDVPVV